jgi:hypothetical protein
MEKGEILRSSCIYHADGDADVSYGLFWLGRCQPARAGAPHPHTAGPTRARPESTCGTWKQKLRKNKSRPQGGTVSVPPSLFSRFPLRQPITHRLCQPPLRALLFLLLFPSSCRSVSFFGPQCGLFVNRLKAHCIVRATRYLIASSLRRCRPSTLNQASRTLHPAPFATDRHPVLGRRPSTDSRSTFPWPPLSQKDN